MVEVNVCPDSPGYDCYKCFLTQTKVTMGLLESKVWFLCLEQKNIQESLGYDGCKWKQRRKQKMCQENQISSQRCFH